MHDPDRSRVLAWILGATLLSTGLHFTHNFIEVDRYPAPGWLDGSVVQVAIVVSWPLLALGALRGFRLYRQGRYAPAHVLLLGFSTLGLITPLHFTSGTPDIPAFWFATIFTDGATGAALAGFVLWSMRRRRGSVRAPHAPAAPAPSVD